MARVVPTFPTVPTDFTKPTRAHTRARPRAPVRAITHYTSDRLEQLEHNQGNNSLECSNLAEGWNKTPEVGTPAGQGTTSTLVWARTSPYSQAAASGHRVSAAKGADAWIYTAWGPDVAPEVSWRDWPPAHLGGREHYKRGEHVPQRYPCLGHYPTAEAARAACEADAKRRGSFCG